MKWLKRIAYFTSTTLLAGILAILFVEFAEPRLDAGVVKPLPPSTICVARGIDNVPADHLIIPVDWQNTRNTDVTARLPYLELQINPNSTYSLSDKHFEMVGAYDSVTEGPAQKYRNQASLDLPANSITTHVMVFRADDYADTTSHPRGEDLRFSAEMDYTAFAGFEQSNHRGGLKVTEPEQLIKIDLPRGVDEMSPEYTEGEKTGTEKPNYKTRCWRMKETENPNAPKGI